MRHTFRLFPYKMNIRQPPNAAAINAHVTFANDMMELSPAKSVSETFGFLTKRIFPWTASSVNKTGSFWERKILYHHSYLPIIMILGRHILKGIYLSIFSTPSDYFRGLFRNSVWICCGTKCLVGLWERHVVYATRCPPASNIWSLQFPLRTFLSSYYCIAILKAFGKRYGLAFLFARLDCSLLFTVRVLEILGVLPKLLQSWNGISLLQCESIPAVALVQTSANFVLWLLHVVPTDVGYTENIVIYFLVLF